MHMAFPNIVLWLFVQLFNTSHGKTYEKVRSLYREKIYSLSYSTDIRPVFNQSSIIHVSMNFEIISIVQVNDVFQSITLNGFVNFNWTDELLAWDPENHGGITRITPKVKDIWKPRMMLINTLEERDPLGDENAPLFVYWDGHVEWYPGGIISASCSLDMTYFPFDKQRCSIYLYSMNHDATEVSFHGTKHKAFPDLNVTGEWELIDITVETMLEVENGLLFPSVQYLFTLRRKPSSFLLTMMIPVCCLSCFNFLVYLIPVSSGEKVSYGITVLLAQSVYMTSLSDMLPRSSGNVPCVTLYVFCLLIISSINVLISVIALFIHKYEKKTDFGAKFRKSSKSEISTDEQFDKRTLNIGLQHFRAPFLSESSPRMSMKEKKAQMWKTTGVIWVNRGSFIVMFTTWITVNIWFFMTTYSR